jgi:hypothetical protein
MGKKLFLIILITATQLGVFAQTLPQNSPKPTLITVPRNNATNRQINDSVGLNNSTIAASMHNNSSSTRYDEHKGMICLNGVIAVPYGEFDKVSNGNLGFGFNGYLAYNPFHKKLKANWIRPYLVGLKFEYVTFNNTEQSFFGGDFAARTETVSRVSQDAFAFGPAGRIELFDSWIYLLAEYHLGLRFFSGSHTISYTHTPYNGDPSNTESASQALSSSIVRYYGFAGGIGFKREIHVKPISEISFEFKLSYQYGGIATSIDPESVILNSNNSIEYSTKRSTTDMFLPQIGISLSL